MTDESREHKLRRDAEAIGVKIRFEKNGRVTLFDAETGEEIITGLFLQEAEDWVKAASKEN